MQGVLCSHHGLPQAHPFMTMKSWKMTATTWRLPPEFIRASLATVQEFFANACQHFLGSSKEAKTMRPRARTGLVRSSSQESCCCAQMFYQLVCSKERDLSNKTLITRKVPPLVCETLFMRCVSRWHTRERSDDMPGLLLVQVMWRYQDPSRTGTTREILSSCSGALRQRLSGFPT